MVEFKRILCPIDYSDTSVRALTYAAAFATWYEARLEVLHVAPLLELPDEPNGAIGGGSDRSALRNAAAEQVRLAIRSVGAASLEPDVVIEEGRGPDVIAARARAGSADLLVMGTHGRSGFNRLLLGSVTEKVMRAVSCPLLTVPPAAAAMTAAAVAFKRILCAIDYSPSSLKALAYALELGRQSDGRVTALYALEYMDPDEPAEHVDVDIRRRREHFVDRARTRLHTQLARESTAWCELEEVVAVDRAYKAILGHATTTGTELIVMGAQGMGGLELMLYGSNTQHVVRAATCPVLTVRA